MSDFDESLLQELPALGATARQLLCLTETERDDSRVLGLIAQKEPVMLARLLSMANSVMFRRPQNVTSAQSAIQVVGSDRAYALMLIVAQMHGFASSNCSVRVRNYLLHQAVSVSLTTQRLARLLQLGAADADDTFLAALLDVLGVYALVVIEHSKQEKVHELLTEHMQGRKALPRELPDLANYRACALALARRWEAGEAVLQTLEAVYWMEQASQGFVDAAQPATLRAKALLLAHELVAAKFANGTLSERAMQLVSHTSGRADSADRMPMGRALELAVLV